MNRASAAFSLRICALFLGLFFFFCGARSQAQELEVGIVAGGCYYLGDLNPGKHFLNTKFAFGVLTRYDFDTRWSVKLSATRGEVAGNSEQTSYLPGRNLTFTSSVTDISAVAEFNFFPYFTGSKRNWITPYIFGGVSLFFFEPKADGNTLRKLGTEGQNISYDGRTPYSPVGFGLPFGLGVKFSLAQRLGMQVFWEIHKTFTDYLDDVSTTYYLDGPEIDPNNPEQYLSDPSMNHQPGMQRGNARNQDWYSLFGLALTYKFNLYGSKRCKDIEHQ